MAILKIARMGHPVLNAVAAPVDGEVLRDTAFQRFLDDMIETMRDERGVGLAAPQVHRSLRLFVMEAPVVDREDLGDPVSSDVESPIVVVNPVLTFPGTERISLWEGCLSMPGIRGRTERARFVHVDALDRSGEAVHLELEGFAAAVVQHETDHLDGVLFPARMPDPSLLAFEDELERHGGVASTEDRLGE